MLPNKNRAYYNEIDKQKAQWIRELVKTGIIAQGEVDDRSIAEVQPQDLAGFTQCHFFAGIAVWSYALRLAGWADDRPVWTGSCPCPSFSAAGKGQGFTDPRHLWPDWARLIRECRPATIISEQVESAIGHGWLDLVQTELEDADYAVGKAVLGACAVGAPHRRQRLYFVAHSQHDGRWPDEQRWGSERRTTAGRDGASGELAHADGRDSGDGRVQRSGQYGQQPQNGLFGQLADSKRGRRKQRDTGFGELQQSSAGSDVGDTAQGRLGMHGSAPGESGHVALADSADVVGESGGEGLEGHAGNGNHRDKSGWFGAHASRSIAAPSSTNFWSDTQWIYCRDGKYRPTGAGVFPLAHGTAHRVAKLRGLGDAIVPQVAAEFIQAFLETQEE